MTADFKKDAKEAGQRHVWYRASELYVRGLLVLLVLLLIGYLINSITDYLAQVEPDPRIVVISLLAILLLPIPLGWLQHRILRNRLIRKRSGRALARMEDRLVKELALDGRRGYPIVKNLLWMDAEDIPL